MEFLIFVCEKRKMYEMKMDNLLVDVEIFSFYGKENLFQAEFQQNKTKLWSSFLTHKLTRHIRGGGGGVNVQGFLSRGFSSGGLCPSVLGVGIKRYCL